MFSPFNAILQCISIQTCVSCLIVYLFTYCCSWTECLFQHHLTLNVFKGETGFHICYLEIGNVDVLGGNSE